MATTLETMVIEPEQESRPDWLNSCEDVAGRYKVVPSVVCSMCCLFGIIYCFFGKLLKNVLIYSWGKLEDNKAEISLH